MTPKHRFLLLAAGLQLAILVGMIVMAMWPLLFGQPLQMRSIARDPRDLMRGNYVVLGFDFQSIDLADTRLRHDFFASTTDSTLILPEDQVLYLTLAKDSTGYFTPTGVFQQKPELRDGERLLQARLTSEASLYKGAETAGRVNGYLNLTAGIENYFATPEDAKRFEDAMRGIDDETRRIEDSLRRVNPDTYYAAPPVDLHVIATVYALPDGKARLKTLEIQKR